MDVGTVPDIWVFFDRCTMEARRAVFHARQAVADWADRRSPRSIFFVGFSTLMSWRPVTS